MDINFAQPEHQTAKDSQCPTKKPRLLEECKLSTAALSPRPSRSSADYVSVVANPSFSDSEEKETRPARLACSHVLSQIMNVTFDYNEGLRNKE